MNTPIHRKIIRALALCSTLALPQVLLAAAPFARAGAHYYSYSSSEYSSEMGGGLAVGLSFGPAGEHEVSLDLAHVAWSWSRPTGLAAGLGFSGEGHLTPVLANYRRYFGAGDARVRWYAGIGAGIVRSSGDAKFDGSGTSYGGSADGTSAAFGGTLGLSGKLSAAVAYDLGYRYLQAQDVDVTTQAGPVLHLPAPSAHVLALGVTVRF